MAKLFRKEFAVTAALLSLLSMCTESQVAAEDLYQAMLRVRCNGVAVLDSKETRVGYALYPMLSMCNHSCGDSNIMLTCVQHSSRLS